MKTLYESILSSTKSGGSAKIIEWWQSNPDFTDKGKFHVENINGKFFIIIDDYSKQPSQYSVKIEKRYLESMPRNLSGIYYTYYEYKDSKGILRPVKLNFIHCSGCKIDLSNWDMSLGPIGRLDIHILIMFSSPDVELIGLPKYKTEFNVQFSHCTDIKSIHDINAPNGEIEFALEDGGYTSINYNDIKNCTLREIFVDKANIIRSTKKYDSNLEFYTVKRGKYIINPQYSECIRNLLKNNTIDILRYNYSKSLDDKSMKRYGGLKIVPFEDTFMIIPITA